jgi:hypothetical protein
MDVTLVVLRFLRSMDSGRRKSLILMAGSTIF